MTVVEEPAEGELIESVVVAVDVLVALRPATINDSVEISKMAGTQNVKYFSIQQISVKGRNRTSHLFILNKVMINFEDKKYEIFCLCTSLRSQASVCPGQSGRSCSCPSRTW